jgi:Tfp pilus assembly protein PilE
MKKYFIKLKNNQSGFVAIFAVLIATIILAITLGVANVSYKEVILASSAKEANFAFYAADTGLECALYGDFKLQTFNNGTNLTCADVNIDPTNVLITTFQLDMESAAGPLCSKVSVDKDFIIDGESYTKIESKGYNMSCTDVDQIPITNNARAVERALRATYPNDTP